VLNCLVDLKPNKDSRRYITLGVIKWRYLLLRLVCKVGGVKRCAGVIGVRCCVSHYQIGWCVIH
jgi:hypothetical protein